jgi:ABC-type dipeptide/oligopeptide/nickel transport system ATPase component
MMLLEAEKLEKKYKKVKAVDGVSFHIAEGEVFGLLGENGAGKTTTIKMLSTQTKSDRGTARIDGVDIFENCGYARSRIAIVPQEINLDRELTVRENLYIYAKLHGAADAGKQIEKTAELFKITDKMKERVQGLSGCACDNGCGAFYVWRVPFRGHVALCVGELYGLRSFGINYLRQVKINEIKDFVINGAGVPYGVVCDGGNTRRARRVLLKAVEKTVGDKLRECPLAG